MAQAASWIAWSAYALPTLCVLAFGAHALVLLALRRKHAPAHLERLHRAKRDARLGRSELPEVLVQVPVFNEAAVAERAIDAVGVLDWPRERLAIQVLDDSTDETRGLVDRASERLRASGTDVRVLRRARRDGFKAGALAAGLRESRAPFVAVFDADFVPPPSFLRDALALFELGEDVACVQGRWEHLNRDQNLLTRAQAVAVDAHFGVQQLARAASARLLNFNGTAGVWRRAAIDDAGGWSGATLTEDLDLSYRAQLRGWRIVFDPELVAPAELPPTLAAFKSQQRRWACGSMQCARRFLGPVWKSALPFGVKLEASFHLCGYAVCVAMVALTVLAPFGLGHLPLGLRHASLRPLWIAVWLAALGPIAVSVAGQRAVGRRCRMLEPLLAMLLGLGACANNAGAVLRGLFRPIPSFVRTPKQGASRLPPGALRVPRTELALAAFTAGTAALLAWRAPAAVATYALFCFSGVWALSMYWWLVERRAGAR